jgi:phenylpyruvate tautomerase PptA (4-oxalocrotonate tautomerase family)
MGQIKIYGRKELFARARTEISDSVHAAVVEALRYPEEKRFHRFLGLDAEDYVHPGDRSADYLIIEISIFTGRSIDAKKRLIRGICSRLADKPGISPQDVEITIFETPRENWGIRGMPGDELALGYQVTV